MTQIGYFYMLCGRLVKIIIEVVTYHKRNNRCALGLFDEKDEFFSEN